MSSKKFRYNNKNIKISKGYKNQKYTESFSKKLIEESEKLSRIGIKLLFFGNGLLNFNNNKENQLRAGIINFVGVTMLSISGLIATVENGISKEPLPREINQEKFIAIIISMTASIILTRILIEEYKLHASNEEIEDTLVD